VLGGRDCLTKAPAGRGGRMKLKDVLLGSMGWGALKAACAELELDADKRSQAAMRDALAGSKKAKPERLLEYMSALEMRNALEALGDPADGNKAALAERLLAYRSGAGSGDEQAVPPARDKGRGDYDAAAPQARPQAPPAVGGTAQYEHGDRAIQRPDAGVQDQFQAKKPPRTYRYDSSLDPALSWDEQRERDLGEWLLALIVRASKEGERAVFAEPQEWKGGGVRVESIADAARLLQDISKPFLNWAGKAERHEIRVPSVPLFVHERHSTKAILDGIRHRKARGQSLDLFGDSQMDIRENLEAYEHQGPWRNRMILGDSLSVMNSLLEFEGMAGQVQMIYIDPPYGVKFGSNFQPFVRKKPDGGSAREVKHGGDEDMTREPEMVKAYRDTWELGLHSYLTYLRDRFTIARELLNETGSLFVQISDDNIHHIRTILEEVFGEANFLAQVAFFKTGAQTAFGLAANSDFLIWIAKDKSRVHYQALYNADGGWAARANDIWLELPNKSRVRRRLFEQAVPEGTRLFTHRTLESTTGSESTRFPFKFEGETYSPKRGWSTSHEGMRRLASAGRIIKIGKGIRFVVYLDDYPYSTLTSSWDDTGTGSFLESNIYVVQTATKVVQRCMLMTTRPGDLVLDPTCGSGTTAFVAEQWGRRWITIDTSRVPLALARQRLLTATFPYYELKSPQSGPGGGFVYRRKQNRKGEEIGGLVPHITLKSIANDEPPAMEVLVDRPEEVPNVTRVTGPFVVEATIAPVQPLGEAEGDGRGESDPATHIERMTEVLRQSKTLRLPGNRELVLSGVRRTVDAEFLHAEAKEGAKRIAIVFGPQDGAVSSTLVYEAGREAHYLKYDGLYLFGFAIEPNARAMIEDERKLRIPVSYVAVTPDVAMSDLLKTTRSSEIFSVTGLPDFEVRRAKKKGPEGQVLYEVELAGLDVFDPQSLETESVGGENVPCWMLDSDYNGMSFCATQVFFPKTSAWDNLQRSLKATFDESVWSHLSGTVSEPFALGEKRRVAVKVIDERGNELLRVREVEQ